MATEKKVRKATGGRPSARKRTAKAPVKPAKKVKAKAKTQEKTSAREIKETKRTSRKTQPAKKTARVGTKAKTKTKGKAEPRKRRAVASRSKGRTGSGKALRTGVLSGVKADERQRLLRQHLIQKREEIVREAKAEIGKYVTGDARQLVETALDDGDWSVIDLSEDVNLRRLETHRESLLKIDAALRKLGEGTYGICEDCGEGISAERLRVMPFAIYCRDCQEKREELEKIEREEIIP
ncbi:MAG: TraR/DksA C4-type zinc finger protein [Nitrospirae bacterium]|nr:TraR/DksA C4-type zinc finger protein [Nitrospirota bacterium]